MIWVVFETEACKHATVKKLNKNKKASMWSCEGSEIWVKQDAPLEERVTSTLLFGMKFLLSSWGCPRNSIWVDVVSNQISCGPEVVAKVSIVDGILHLVYGEGVGFLGRFHK